ncbi:CapA family protein [Spirochaetota bacterium]
MKRIIIILLLLTTCAFSSSKYSEVLQDTFTSSRTNAIKLLFTGDIMHNMSTYYKSLKHKEEYTTFFSLVSNHISDADIAVCNLESPVSFAHSIRGYPRFNAPVKLLKALKSTGFDIVTTANNHAMDQYKSGLLNTLRAIRDHDFVNVGTSAIKNSTNRIYFTNSNNIKIAFIAYTYSLNGINHHGHVNLFNFNQKRKVPKKIISDIHYAKSRDADLIILFAHWGFEYENRPRRIIRKYAHMLCNAGADIIIGTHPHVLQPVEYYRAKDKRECFIAYSLGNFLSSGSYKTNLQGLMLKMYVYRQDGAVRYDVYYTGTYNYMHQGDFPYIFNISDILNNHKRIPEKYYTFLVEQKKYIDYIIGGKRIENEILEKMENDLKELRETTFKKRNEKFKKK